MTLYTAIIGELIIIEAFVVYIWLQVLSGSLKSPIDSSIAGRKVLLTSIGLVLTALCIMILMFIRFIQINEMGKAFIPAVIACYVGLAIGNILFMVSASIGNSLRQLKLFLFVTAVWTGIAAFLYLK